jgi:hypothetical protein
MPLAQQVERQVFVLTASVRHFLYRSTYSTTGLLNQSGYSYFKDNLCWNISSPSLAFLLSEMPVAQQVERQVFVLTALVRHFLYKATYTTTGLLQEASPGPHNTSSVRGKNCKAMFSGQESLRSALCG